MEINKTNRIHVVLGNQLFPIKYLKKLNIKHVFMKEDIKLCTYEKHHKQKITSISVGNEIVQRHA